MVKALILTGGKSQRMGMDKAFIDYHGQPQYRHLYDMLMNMQIPVCLSCSSEQEQKFVSGLNTLIDVFPSSGPITGLYSAFQLDPDADWLILACDMPLINSASISNLIKQHGEYDITTYQSELKPFPEVVFTIYTPKVLPILETAVAEKQFSLQALLRQSKVEKVTPIDNQVLLNVNDKDDLRQVEEILNRSN